MTFEQSIAAISTEAAPTRRLWSFLSDAFSGFWQPARGHVLSVVSAFGSGWTNTVANASVTGQQQKSTYYAMVQAANVVLVAHSFAQRWAVHRKTKGIWPSTPWRKPARKAGTNLPPFNDRKHHGLPTRSSSDPHRLHRRGYDPGRFGVQRDQSRVSTKG